MIDEYNDDRTGWAQFSDDWEMRYRLTRSLTDFSKLVEVFDRHGVSFVSVTQQFNTTTSMGPISSSFPSTPRGSTKTRPDGTSVRRPSTVGSSSFSVNAQCSTRRRGHG